MDLNFKTPLIELYSNGFKVKCLKKDINKVFNILDGKEEQEVNENGR